MRIDLFGRRAAAERDFLHSRLRDRPNSNWIGAASDSLVSVALGGSSFALPHDAGDLWRCYATVMRMPPHLRTGRVRTKLVQFERMLTREQVILAQEHANWPGWVW